MNQHYFRLWILNECCDISLDVIRWVVFPYIGEKYVDCFIFYNKWCKNNVCCIHLYCGDRISIIVREFYQKICTIREGYIKLLMNELDDEKIKHIIRNIETIWTNIDDEVTVIRDIIGTLYKNSLDVYFDDCEYTVEYLEHNKKEYATLYRIFSNMEVIYAERIDVNIIESILIDDRFITLVDTL